MTFCQTFSWRTWRGFGHSESGFQTLVIHIYIIFGLNPRRKVDLPEPAIIPLRVQSTCQRLHDFIRNHLRV